MWKDEVVLLVGAIIGLLAALIVLAVDLTYHWILVPSHLVVR